MQAYATYECSTAIRNWLQDTYGSTLLASKIADAASWLAYIEWAHPEILKLLIVARRVLDWLAFVRHIPLEKHPDAVVVGGGQWFEFVNTVESVHDKAELLVFTSNMLFDPVRAIRFPQWPVGGPISDSE